MCYSQYKTSVVITEGKASHLVQTTCPDYWLMWPSISVTSRTGSGRKCWTILTIVSTHNCYFFRFRGWKSGTVQAKPCLINQSLWMVNFLSFSSSDFGPKHCTSLPHPVRRSHFPPLFKAAQLLPWQPRALPHQRWGSRHDSAGFRKSPLGRGNRK